MSETGAPKHPDFGDPELNSIIAAGMERVEESLADELNQGAEFITDKVKHLAFAGGKRFRPMFALLAAQFGPDSQSANVIQAATVVELTHLATLYHDDVMDEAERRRGVPSANSRWNNSVAILAGDYLLARVAGIMAQLGMETVKHFSETFGVLVTGQMRETVGFGSEDPIQHYMNVISEKTGVLIASAGYLGALHAGAKPEHVAALRTFGDEIGMVFQIVDDVIDIYSDPAISGKTPGTDLREGVFTLPVLYALEEQTPVGEELRGLLTGPLTNEADVTRALELLGQSTGRERALESVHHYLARAHSALDELPDSAATLALRQLANYSVSRLG